MIPKKRKDLLYFFKKDFDPGEIDILISKPYFILQGEKNILQGKITDFFKE